MCVEVNQEHLSLMGEHCLRRDRVVLVCPDQHVAPATRIDQCKQKARTKNAHAKYFVSDHPVSRPDKIYTHAQTCQRNACMHSEL